MLYFVAVLLCAVAVTNAQVFSLGDCPKYQVKQDFNLKQYIGKWFEIQKFYAVFERNQICVTANYSFEESGNIKVLNAGYSTSEKKLISIVGTATVPDPTQPARIKVSFYPGTPKGDYNVIDTDFEKYSIVYSCTSLAGFARVEFAWILAREPTLDEETLDKIYSTLKKNGINTKPLMKTDQSPDKCKPYW